MKRLIQSAVLLCVIIAIAAPAAIGQETRDTDEERIVKRIIIRDGEVIEMNGEPLRLDEIKLAPLGERTFLGVHIMDITTELRTFFRAPEDRGVLVSAISEDSPAMKAGLKAGDVLLSIDGDPLSSAGALRRLIREHSAGDSVELEVIRSGNRQKLYATLEQRKLELPRIEMRDGDRAFRYRLDESKEPALRKLQEYFSSPEWETRVNRLPNCTEIQAKLEAVQHRLEEMEKKLEQMK